MKETLNVNQADTQQDNGALLRILNKGIDDMEAGRETLFVVFTERKEKIRLITAR